MSEAFATLATGYVHVMHNWTDYEKPPMDGTWGRVERRILMNCLSVMKISKLSETDKSTIRSIWRCKQDLIQGNIIPEPLMCPLHEPKEIYGILSVKKAIITRSLEVKNTIRAVFDVARGWVQGRTIRFTDRKRELQNKRLHDQAVLNGGKCFARTRYEDLPVNTLPVDW